ncbi:MAG: hypothetical protein V7765_21175 [Oleispira sp.]
MELSEIEKEGSGFKYQLQDNESLGAAFITLRLALKSWFCTHEPERYPSYNRLWANGGVGSQAEHSREYCELYVQTVVHLQHFCELIFQNILRSENQFFADKACDQKEFNRLIDGGQPSAAKWKEKGSINFLLQRREYLI